jgi:hypothetical protein
MQLLTVRNVILFVVVFSMGVIVPRSPAFTCWKKIHRTYWSHPTSDNKLRIIISTNEVHSTEQSIDDNLKESDPAGFSHTSSRSLFVRQVQYADSIVRLDLVNAVTDRKIGPVFDGSTIVLNQYGLSLSNQISFEAIPSSDRVGYVSFSVTSSSYFTSTDSSRASFALCGNFRQNFSRCYSLNLGTNKITATPYTYSNWRWIKGTSYSITVKIVQSQPAPVPVPVKSPTLAPQKPPTSAPIKSPTLAPIQSPTLAPIQSPPNCTVPKVSKSTLST